MQIGIINVTYETLRDKKTFHKDLAERRCMVIADGFYEYINTLMIQRILGEPNWTQRMTPEDLRALTPLIYTHVTPYGTFRLDMSKRLDIDEVRATA